MLKMKKGMVLKDLSKQFAKRIRTLRKLKKLTQEELGARSDVSYKYLGKIERCEVNPSLDILGKIAKGFEVSLKDLMDVSETSNGLNKENIVYPLSKNEFKIVRDALEILERVFKKD